MGHYCRICGRTRSNEKFSGKGHKNHVCKDCSGKSGKKVKESPRIDGIQTVDDLDLLFGAWIHSEEISFEESSYYDHEFEIYGGDEEDDEDEFEIVGIEEDDDDFNESDEGYEDIPF